MSEARVQNERLNRANAILTNDVPKPAPGAKERVWRGVERHRRPWRMRLGWPEAVVFAAALGVVFFVRRADAPAPQVAWRSVPTGGAVSAHGATIRSLGASTVRTPPVEAGRTIVQVVDGHLAFDVAARGAGETFEVQTRHAIVTVVGTRFAVRADDDGTVVEVEEGIVEVSARSGTTRRLRAGERIRIASAAALAGHAGAAPSSGRSPDRREGREGLDVVAADARASDGRGPGDGAGADGHHDARTPTEAKASGDRIAANGAAADEDIPEASTAVKGAAANGASGRGAAANAAAWNGATRNRGATVGAAANGAAVKSASGRGAAANAAAPDGATGNRGAAANGAAVKSASGRGAAANAAAPDGA
ncbi:MAG: FecR domain-containing protein, partial [Deltaproteobacteria bacterium]